MEQNATSFREEEERDLRAAVQHAVDQICATESNDENASPGGTAMSRSAIKALSELAFQYATTSLSNDLVWFSRHANRRTVTVDDVKLVARKNPNHLLSHLESFAEQQKVARGVHTMETVEKERNVLKSPKKQRKSAAAKNPKKTATRKKTKTAKELRREEARDRLLNEIDGSDSSDNSMLEIKQQDIDASSSDSDSSGLPPYLREKKKDTAKLALQREAILNDSTSSSSSDDDDVRKRITSNRGLKRLRLGPSQQSNARKKSSGVPASSFLRSGDSSDSDDESCVQGKTGNKDNKIKSQSSLEVLDVQSQDFEY